MKWQDELDNLVRIDYVKDRVVMSDIEILITSLLKQQREICGVAYIMADGDSIEDNLKAIENAPEPEGKIKDTSIKHIPISN